MHCTCHRVFLASLIVAAKYLNDQSPKNKHWSAHSTVFSVGEVNLMEKQLLALLDFDLRITEADLASSLHEFLQQQQSTVSAPNATTASTVAPERPISRYASGATPLSVVTSTVTKASGASSMVSPTTPSPRSSVSYQSTPLIQLSSNKRGSISSRGSRTQFQVIHHQQQQQQPQDVFRRRPSLPNQPCLEEGETLYNKHASRGYGHHYQQHYQYSSSQHPHHKHQSHYPSPDSGSDAYPSQRSSDEEMTPVSASAASPPEAAGYIGAQRSWPVYGRHSMPPPAAATGNGVGYTHYSSSSSSSSSSGSHYQGYGRHESSSAGRHGAWAAAGATSRAMC
ncbi:hypothetical protein BGX23_007926, partial [Mortierella sp. AD031]